MQSRTLIWVTPTQIQTIGVEADLPNNYGAKARGLAWIPPAWVPDYLVLSPDFHQQYISSKKQQSLLSSWADISERSLKAAGLDGCSKLYLRSNAVSETLTERGKYKSFQCNKNDLIQTLGLLFDEAIKRDSKTPIGVIVQRFVKPIIFGHLSNERRVAEEYRDSVVELIYEHTGEMAEERLSFRRWRNQKGPDTDALICGNPEDVMQVLREPLAYAAMHKRRVHYEWVWDGAYVYLVQADHALEQNTGISPESVIRKQQEQVAVENLQRFRIATQADSKLSGKLRNHFYYEESGFRQPTIYILHGRKLIEGILDGELDSQLISDLEILTIRPIVIRTSCSNAGKTFLPRSDLLNSKDEAIKWLTGKFREEIRQKNLMPGDVTLIAHHYIPALAAAFSTASPGKREVYIEALWGIPEGLYYFPCDAYYIDTQSVDANELGDASKSKFTKREKLRYKGQFVAPNEQGKFVVHKTAAPSDWKSTIGDSETLADMALFTRRLSATEGKSVKVMWFIGCASWTNLPTALPWYHDNEAEDIAESSINYQRNSRDEIFELRTLNDLESLERKAKEGYIPQNAHRLVISLNPIEDQVIRDEEFALRVGNAARSLNSIIELRGGILSHVYYALQRTGAIVFTLNRAGFSSSVTPIHKLVRDRIPDVVSARGETAKISHLSPRQLKSALKIKLIEEAFEARDAGPEELVYELADVLEVIDGLVEAAGISPEELESVRLKKRQQRGGFKEGVLLVETSLGARVISSTLLPRSDTDRPSGIIETNIPHAPERATPGAFDIRHGQDFMQLVHNVTIDLSKHEWTISSPRRIRVDGKASVDIIEWTVEGKREGAQMKLRLKILLGTPQLELPFDADRTDGDDDLGN